MARSTPNDDASRDDDLDDLGIEIAELPDDAPPAAGGEEWSDLIDLTEGQPGGSGAGSAGEPGTPWPNAFITIGDATDRDSWDVQLVLPNDFSDGSSMFVEGQSVDDADLAAPGRRDLQGRSGAPPAYDLPLDPEAFDHPPLDPEATQQVGPLAPAAVTDVGRSPLEQLLDDVPPPAETAIPSQPSDDEEPIEDLFAPLLVEAPPPSPVPPDMSAAGDVLGLALGPDETVELELPLPEIYGDPRLDAQLRAAVAGQPAEPGGRPPSAPESPMVEATRQAAGPAAVAHRPIPPRPNQAARRRPVDRSRQKTARMVLGAAAALLLFALGAAALLRDDDGGPAEVALDVEDSTPSSIAGSTAATTTAPSAPQSEVPPPESEPPTVTSSTICRFGVCRSGGSTVTTVRGAGTAPRGGQQPPAGEQAPPPAEEPPAPSDSDGDGVADGGDNCSGTPNADQADTDGDGLGDACDGTPNGDDDGDGVDNASDNCPGTANADQADDDGDGLGDACDPTPHGDNDGDGVDNLDDNCRNRSNPGQEDTDGDGRGDVCDPTPNGDDDGDGVDNNTDNCPGTSNPGQEDADGDGRGNACDPTPDGEEGG